MRRLFHPRGPNKMAAAGLQIGHEGLDYFRNHGRHFPIIVRRPAAAPKSQPPSTGAGHDRSISPGPAGKPVEICESAGAG